ncbi:MAG: hypothetical protein AAB300_01205 [Nitrospirota bacterium]
MDKSRPTAVLYGDLNMLRCFHNSGIPTYILSSDPKELAFYSTQCQQKKIIANPNVAPHQTVCDLVEFGKEFSVKPILFYGDDGMTRCISENRSLLSNYYHFLLPPMERVTELLDKALFISLSKRLNLPSPKSVSSREAKSPKEVLQALSLPCVLKPTSHVGWFQSNVIIQRGGVHHKALMAHSPDALDILYEEVKKVTDEFVIQEYIPGGDNHIYSFHAYFNGRSEPMGYFSGRKIRTYPSGSGESAFIELVNEPALVRIGIDILKRLDYVGFAKLDFKKDTNRNQFFLLEINPRFTLWNYLGAACGVNLPLLAYQDILECSPMPQIHYVTNVKWLFFYYDVKSFLESYRKEGAPSFLQWVLSYQGKKIYNVFSWRDPYPFIVSCWRSFRAIFGAISRRLVKGKR